jgi:3-methyl-2-oxobutanoate hydroxymethyltransferase
MPAVTINTLATKKRNREKFAVITTYDATFARVANAAAIEVILIGDSLGNVLQGQGSTVPVTVEDMIYHTQCVARGNSDALLWPTCLSPATTTQPMQFAMPHG